MNSHLLIFIISAAVYALILITIPFRKKYILNRAGKLILNAGQKSIILSIFVVILGALLILISFMRDLGTTGTIVICLTAILGGAMSSEEASLNSSAGIYSNGLIGGGHFLPVKEIFSVPFLSLSAEDQKNNPSSSLKIITDKKGTVTFFYASAEECSRVLNELIKLKPSLKN